MKKNTTDGCCRSMQQDQQFSHSFIALCFVVLFSLIVFTGNAETACQRHSDCDDGNSCTVDKCHQGACQYKPVPLLEFEYDNDVCFGDSSEIENESEGVDPAATYYLDLGSDGSIDFSIPAAALPNDSTLVLPITGDINFTVIVVNPNGCSDTLEANISITDCDDNDPCTVEECDDGECEHALLCDDDNPCTIDECVADAAAERGAWCKHTAIDCDDGDPCTTDACDDGDCEHESSKPKLEFEYDKHVCAGSIVEIKNESEHVDLNATYYLDINSDGSIEGSISAADLPSDSSLVIPLTGDISFTVIVVNPDGCSDTLDASISILDCDDGDPCTTDECDDGRCRHEAVDCSDGDACTTDVCDNGNCVHDPVNCDDADACTTDECVGTDDDGDDACRHTSICSDGDPCTEDVCDNGNCSFPALNCDDSDPCTTDECNEEGECKHSPLCNDGDRCTIDACDNGVCSFTPLNCDDSNPCTLDVCRGGRCKYYLNICNDNDPCTQDACNNGACLYTPIVCNDGNLCTMDNCINGICKYRKCSDGDPCTIDGCNSNGCYYVPKNCADRSVCTTDFCDNGVCRHVSGCDDGDPCTHNKCGANGCYYVPRNCNDNNPCTRDFCLGGTCLNIPICHDDDPCTEDLCLNGNCLFAPIDPCDASGNKKPEVSASEYNIASLKAYPNPFSEKLHFEFILSADSKVKFEIFNLSGQRIAELFEGNVKSGASQRFDFTPNKLAEGMLIYRLQTESGSYYGKAVMVR